MKRVNWSSTPFVVFALWLLASGTAQAIWKQVNEDGFGAARCNSSWAMAVFNDNLYVGAALPGRLYRTDGIRVDATEPFRWTAVALPRTFPGMTDYEVTSINALKVLEAADDRWLYAATAGIDHGDGRRKNVLLRSTDGVAWEPTGNVWHTDFHGETVYLEAFGGQLYVSIGDASYSEGRTQMKLLRTDGSGWELLDTDAIGLGADDYYFGDLKAFSGHLYAGTSGRNDRPGGDRTAEVWRSVDGTTWVRVAELHSPTMAEIESMEVFDGYLYVGTKNHPPEGMVSTGPQLWRSRDGTTWEQVPTEGQFSPLRLHVDTLRVYGDRLYAGIGGGDSPAPIASIYSSADGLAWEEETPAGLAGDETNYLMGSMGVAWGNLVVGTGFNTAGGSEVWVYDPLLTYPMRPARIPDPSDLGPRTLSLIDCGTCPMCFENFCDPRINPKHDLFLVWDQESGIAETIDKRRLGLGVEDGPITAAAPLKLNGETNFVAAAPYADGKATDGGMILLFDKAGNVVSRIHGKAQGERLGIDLDVRHNEAVAVSSRTVLRISEGKVVQSLPVAEGLRAQLGAQVAFTDDLDGDKRPEILLGTPYSDAGGLQEAGQIQVIGSRRGEVIDTLYGRRVRQHFGATLQSINTMPRKQK